VNEKDTVLHVALEGEKRCEEYEIVFKDRRDVSARAIQVEADEQPLIALVERHAEKMRRNDELTLQALRRNEAVAISVSVGRAHVRPAKRRGFEIAFDTARESAGTIDISAESPQP